MKTVDCSLEAITNLNKMDSLMMKRILLKEEY